MQQMSLYSSIIDTPIGSLFALADKNGLHLLQFSDYKNLSKDIKQLQSKTKSIITRGTTESLDSIKKELDAYFAGALYRFKTPINFHGSPFQKTVWEALEQIPFGTTQSYASLAEAIGKPTACRAVAQANGANKFVIIVPCHRIINKNGNLGGYNSGLKRKQWLLNHEKIMSL